MDNPKHTGFNPTQYYCAECGYPLRSSYSGEYVSCPSHGNAVDQTEWYERRIGNVVQEYYGTLEL